MWIWKKTYLQTGNFLDGAWIHLEDNRLTRFESEVFESWFERSYVTGYFYLNNSNFKELIPAIFDILF